MVDLDVGCELLGETGPQEGAAPARTPARTIRVRTPSFGLSDTGHLNLFRTLGKAQRATAAKGQGKFMKRRSRAELKEEAGELCL